MFGLFTKENWKNKRAENMAQARSLRKFFIEQRGYAPDDERIKKGVGYWVARARHAHKIYLSRIPVIPNAIVVNGGEAFQGSIYANQETYGEKLIAAHNQVIAGIL